MTHIQQQFDQLSQAIKDHGELQSYGLEYANETLIVYVFSDVDSKTAKALGEHPGIKFEFAGAIKESRPRIRKSIWRQTVQL